MPRVNSRMWLAMLFAPSRPVVRTGLCRESRHAVIVVTAFHNHGKGKPGSTHPRKGTSGQREGPAPWALDRIRRGRALSLGLCCVGVRGTGGRLAFLTAKAGGQAVPVGLERAVLLLAHLAHSRPFPLARETPRRVSGRRVSRCAGLRARLAPQHLPPPPAGGQLRRVAEAESVKAGCC